MLKDGIYVLKFIRKLRKFIENILIYYEVIGKVCLFLRNLIVKFGLFFWEIYCIILNNLLEINLV